MISIAQGSPNFLVEGHITYYTTARGPDTLRTVIVSGYDTFYQIKKFFVNILFFFIIDKMASRAEVRTFLVQKNSALQLSCLNCFIVACSVKRTTEKRLAFCESRQWSWRQVQVAHEFFTLTCSYASNSC